MLHIMTTYQHESDCYVFMNNNNALIKQILQDGAYDTYLATYLNGLIYEYIKRRRIYDKHEKL